MGEDFWTHWQKRDCFQHLSDSKITRNIFICARVVFQVYTESAVLVQTAVGAPIPTNDDNKTLINSSSTSNINTNILNSDHKEAPLTDAATSSFAISGSLQVLIIEDSKAQRKIMMKRLQLASGQLTAQTNRIEDSWVVGAASNGEEALQLIETQHQMFDIVIVDENLGGSGGILTGHEVHSLVVRDRRILFSLLCYYV